MEALLTLLIIYLVAVLVILPIWVIVKILGHDGDLELLQSRLRSQEDELQKLRATIRDQIGRASGRERG